MKLRPIAATSAVLILSCATVAQAQTSAARPSAPAGGSQTPPPQGAALPGVCVISNEGAVYASAAGKAMLARLSQLNSQAEAEIKGQQTSIQNDAKTLESQKASLPADQYQQRGQALQQRVGDLQRTAQIRQREMQLTQEKALQTFGGYLDPVMRQVFTQRSCSVLLNENALVYPAPAMDITRQVVQGLDAKVQTFTFDREHVDPNSAAAQPR
jgi:Skp family chaperone for outer membrane proteins